MDQVSRETLAPAPLSYAELNGDTVGPSGAPTSSTRVRCGENEFLIDLSWRIDPDGSLGIRQWFESEEHPGVPVGVDEYYMRPA